MQLPFTKETLESAKAKSKLLASSLENAKAALAAAMQVSAKLALDGADDERLKAAASNVRDCSDIVAARQNALITKDAEVAALQAKRDEANDLQARDATVREIEAALAKGKDIERRLSAVLVEATDFAKFALLMAPESQGLLNYCEVSALQIPEAMVMLDRLMREHAAGVLRKSMPATLKRSAPVAAPVIVPPPPMTTVFATRSIKYTDPRTNKLVLAAQFRDLEMPAEYARAALDHKVCVRLEDPMRKQYHAAAGGHPNPQFCFDLDAAMKIPRAVAAETIRSTAPQFEVTIGKPITLKVATRSTP
jgi:hypothetical protein